MHTAFEDKKKLYLLVGSFSVSIVLFMGVSVFLDFAHRATKSLKPYTPDISISDIDYLRSISVDSVKTIEKKTGVKCVYGRMYEGSLDVISDKDIDYINLISYENNQFAWAGLDNIQGDLSLVQNNDYYVATIYDKSNPLTIGDRIVIKGKEREIACVLFDSPFDSGEIPVIVCSEKSFANIMGDYRYSVIDIKVERDITDFEVEEIRNAFNRDYVFSDRREINRSDTATYWASRFLIYGFLIIIGVITIFHIINSLFMNVLARHKQYVIMRTIGMSNKQVIKMIMAEALTYAVIGTCLGEVIGVIVNRIVFMLMVTAYYGDQWVFPVYQISIVVAIVLLAVFLGVKECARYILAQSYSNLSSLT